MQLAFNAVFPLLAFMLLGYFLRRVKLLDEATAAGLNRLMFRVCLPLGIFQSVYSADLRSAFDLRLALLTAIGCTAFFLLSSRFVNRRESDPAIAPVMIQGIYKSNYNLMVMPIVASFFGGEIGMAAVLVIIFTPITNACATIAFEAARGGGERRDGRYYLDMGKKVLLNPMVFSSLLGLLFNAAGVKLPALVMNSVVSKLAAMATPMAMMALGSGFDFRSMKKWARRLAVVCAGKLLLMPLVFMPIAIALGIRGADLIAALIVSGSPTAVNSYSLAVSMGGNEELAGEIVAVTSLLSVFTLFIFLTLLGNWGLL